MLRRFVGPLIANEVMPSYVLPNDFDRTNRTLDSEIQLSFFNTPSTEGAIINFCEVATLQNSKKDIKNQKIIIHAMGNYDIYESRALKEFPNAAKKFPDARIVGFNFRGVQASKGVAQSEDDWIDDAIAVINHYRQLGVPLENILLNGQSLGAAILTMAAARIYREEKSKVIDPKLAKSVKLLNCRSFSSLTDIVIQLMLKGVDSGLYSGFIYGTLGLVAAHLGAITFISPLGLGLAIGASLIVCGFIYDKIPKAFIKPWVNAMLSVGFGTIDALSAYNELPAHAKDYLMVENDGVTEGPAGLHAGLKSERSKRKQAIRVYIEDNVVSEKSKQLENELLNIKDSKLFFPENPIDGFMAHNVSLERLFTSHKARKKDQQISGQEVANNKIRRLLGIKS